MTNEPIQTGHGDEPAYERAEAVNPGSHGAVNDEKRLDEVAETVNPGPSTGDFAPEEHAQHRAQQVNPGPHDDLSDDAFESGVAARVNPGPQQ